MTRKTGLSSPVVFLLTFPRRVTKTYLYDFDPLKPHFYIVKLGFTGVNIMFLISAQKHRLWYSLEPPRRGGSNKYLQSMFWAEMWKKISEFLSENFQFLVVKFSIYLNMRVFVMGSYVAVFSLCVYGFICGVYCVLTRSPSLPFVFRVVLGIGQNFIVDHRFCRTDWSSKHNRLVENIFTLNLALFQVLVHCSDKKTGVFR